MNQDSDILVKDVIIMLGNFHTIMNLLGCIGSLIDGSGLSTIYAENTVNHMLSGKAYFRALRGHLIVDQISLFCCMSK